MYRNLGRILVGFIVLIASSWMFETAEQYGRRNATGKIIDSSEELTPMESARLATAERLYLAADLIGLGGIVLTGMGACPYGLRLLGWLLIPDLIRARFRPSNPRNDNPALPEELACDTAAQS